MQSLDEASFHPNGKVAQIIITQKPAKSAELAESHRSISLLPILSKLF